MSAATDALLARLRAVVGVAHVLTDPDRRAGYETDWTGAWSGTALAVVRPGGDEEVVDVLSACFDAGVPVVPQGGNTGLVGGGVPVDGGVVLTTQRLRSLGPVGTDGTVCVGAGVSLAEVQRHAQAAGWQLGVDLAAREQATIGGMVATDAGGVSVVGHGPMREHVVGMVAVMPDSIVRWGGLGTTDEALAHDDLRDQLVGSEGTLGVITQLQLQLQRPATVGATVLLRVEHLDQLGAVVADVVARAQLAGVRLLACELMTPRGVELVAASLGASSPVRGTPGALLLLDLAAPADHATVAALAAGVDDDPVVALDATTRRALWELRERHTEVVAARQRPVKLDVAVPVRRLGEVLERLDSVLDAAAESARAICWGHAAEGRLHVNVLDAIGLEQPVTAAVYDLIADVGGSVVSEHGAGRAKLAHRHLTDSPETDARDRAVKESVDPLGLMNPGVRLPARRGDGS